MRQLLVAGASGLIVFALILGLLMARYKGYILHPKVDVTADLSTTGDGLPDNADVKFRGILVGSVKNVAVAAKGARQQVHIEMKPDFIGNIPSTVTARVVPRNLFAITSVELVYNGPAESHLRAGSIIAEDHSQGTIALQDALTTVRTILDKIDPVQLGRVLGTLSYGLESGSRVPGSTVERLDNVLAQLRKSVPDPNQTLDNFSASMHALNQSAPELMGSLAESVQTAKTISDKRSAVTGLITGTESTVDKVNALFAANGDAGERLTAGTGDLFGALTDQPDALPIAVANLNASIRGLGTTFHWGPQKQMVWNMGLTFTPYKPYDRGDCPRYGAMAGPSCDTAPAVSDPGTLPGALKPRVLDSAKGLPKLPAIAGLPAIPGYTAQPQNKPNTADPFAGTPLQNLFPHGIPGLAAPAAASPNKPASAQLPTAPAAAPIAGTVDYTGDAAITALLGHRPNVAEYVLLSSILRGGTLQVTENGAGR